MRFGVHVPISRGPQKAVEFALERDCEAAQIFSSNPRGWALSKAGPDSDRALHEALTAKDIRPVLLHTPYLVNIAAPDADVYAKSVASLVHAADRGRRLDGYVIVHAGRDAMGPREAAVERSAAALVTALKLVPSARLLVEPTTGGRGVVAARVEQVAELLHAVDDERVGVCPDTCHAHATGYELATAAGATGWLDELERMVGFERIPVLHVNDSRDACGSNRDRHWHIGEGEIGETGMRTVLRDPRLRDLAVVLETPGRLKQDRANLARARSYVS